MARLKTKYLLLTLALILIPFAVLAWNTAIIGGGVPSDSGGCSGNYGYQESGTNQYLPGQAAMIVTRISLGCSGDPSGMTCGVRYCNLDSREVRYVVYNDNGSGTDPGSLAGYTDKGYSTISSCAAYQKTDWASGHAPSISGDPTYIWIGVAHEHAFNGECYDSSTGGATRVITGTSYVDDPPPANWPTGTDTPQTWQMDFQLEF